MTVKNRITKQLFLAACLVISSTSYADVNSDLNDFFNRLGGGANVSAGGAYQSQSAGYLMGGSFYARTPVRNIQLISISVPDVKAGCGGIDAFLGAFSYINSEQLKALAKQILSNAVGYAFDLALETTMPLVKSVKDYLQKLANDVNSLNVSTCQAAQGIVGGLFPKMDATSQYICNTIANQNSVFADWAAARQGCGTGGDRNNVLNNKSNTEQKKVVPRNRNLTWEALNKVNGFISSDRQLKELMMSVVGTVIYDNNGNITVVPSMGTNNELISALLNGGTAQMYVCNETSSCLQPRVSQLTIQESKSLVKQTTTLLESIFDKVKRDEVLSNNERALIEGTRIKLLRYIIDVAQLNKNSSFITNLSEYIALDYTLSYVDSLVDLVDSAGASASFTDEESKQFQTSLNNVRTKFGQLLSKVKIKQDAFIEADNQLMQLRKQLSNSISSKMMQNYDWGN